MLPTMLKKAVFVSIALAIAASLLVSSASAAEKEIVGYRLKKWQTIHFDDAKKAELHMKTVKKLGCGVKTDDHGGHIDVSYCCPKWREIAFKNHDSAHKWEKWLKASGFETRHEH